MIPCNEDAVRAEEHRTPEVRPYYPRSVVQVIHGVRELICQDLSRHYTLPELAERFNISETRLKRCFRAVYGQSVYAYLKQCRMERGAEELLRSCRTVSEISVLVGYDNPSKFTAAFRTRYGITPTEYRRRMPAAVSESA